MNTGTYHAANPPADRLAPSGGSTGVGQAYLLFFVCLLLVVFVGSVVQLASFSIGLLFTELFCILLPAIVFVRSKRVPIAEGLGCRPIPVSLALMSVLVGISGWGVAAGLAVMTAKFVGPSPTADLFRLETLGQLVTMIVCGAIAAGVCEEALFRGVIQGVLSRLGKVSAVLISAALFAVFHVDPWNVIALFALGTLLGIVAMQSKSIVPAMLAHLANNTTSFTTAYVLREEDQLPTELLLALSACFLVVFPVFLRLARQQPDHRPALASVPAGLSTVGAWLLGICGGLLGVFFTACFVAFVGFIQLVDVDSNHLEPDLSEGQKALVQKNTFVDFPISEGDLVAFREDDQQHVGRVTRVEDDTIWIDEDGTERSVPREAVFGKVIQGL